jgi:arginyl-tRNA synthetase
MVEQLVDEGVAIRQEDGSVVAPLDKYGIDVPILLEKSNGAALYATSDLATLRFRYEKWHPDKVIYVVGSEQQFHFKQIFALADELGFHADYHHYWFGMIDQINEDGTRSKMSSRKGVILLEELLDKAEDEARKHAVDPDKLTPQSVKQIALGAIKFTDFAQDKKTPILFDWDRIFSMQSFSGPYIQYAAVRVRSIIRKFGTVEWAGGEYDWEAEHTLLLHVARYPQIIEEAARFYEPHRLAQYVYDLAKLLNQYYEHTQVGNAGSELIRNARLSLLGIVYDIFESGLGILGIEIPQKM